MEILFQRTRLIGNAPCCTYDILVPTAQTGFDRAKHHYFVVSDGTEYVRLEDALTPDAHRALPRGRDRYNAWCALVGDIAMWVWPILTGIFPELIDSEPRSGDVLTIPKSYADLVSKKITRNLDIPACFR